MNAALSPFFTRFAGFIASLRTCIAAASAPVRGQSAAIPAPFGILFHKRFGQIIVRLRALVVRIEAEQNGLLRRRSAPTTRTGRVKRQAKPATQPALPRRFGWIAQHHAGCRGHTQALRELLCEPAIEAAIATDPRIGRLLRPVCHMLGVDLTTIYRMVSNHRPTQAQPVAPPRPDPDPMLTRRHPLLPANAVLNRPIRPRRPRPPPPYPNPPLQAVARDDIQPLLDRLFGRTGARQIGCFEPPNFIQIHSK